MPLHRSIALLCLAASGLWACGGSPPPDPAPGGGEAQGGGAAGAEEVAPSASAPTLAEGVLQLRSGCVEGATEACNALDDDCDGTIDEGCDARSGPVQIALAWNNGADLDLYVTEPGGFTLSFQSRQSEGDGHFEHDARGDCSTNDAEEGPRARLENAYFGPEAAPGAYQVEVHHFAACGTEGPATASVSVSVRGEVLGTYNLSLDPGERVPVLRFEL